MKRLGLLALLVVSALGAGVALSARQVPAPQAGRVRPIEIKPVAESDTVHPGATLRLALEVTVPDGLHVQSDKPSDPSLIPTVLAINPPAGVTALDAAYPPSISFVLKGTPDPLKVFEHRFVIGLKVAVDKAQAPGDLTIPGQLTYQACDDTMCFRPVKVSTSWTLHVVPASVKIRSPYPELFSSLKFAGSQPPPTFTAAVVPSNLQIAKSPDLQIQDALALVKTFTIAGTTGGYLSKSEFLTFIKNAEAGVKPKGLFEGRGPIAILAIVFLGGLALNLTPCVLPMIPINLAIIGAGTQAGNRRRGFLLGATYGGAMAVIYGVLGLVVILTAGTFGTINASPWFNLGIAALFVFLGLAMFDVVSLDFSKWSSNIRFKDESRGTFVLAFSMGAIAALLAGACVAPVVIQVVIFASNLYATGSTTALALPFVLGLGMALPWPIAGAGLASLPKPGAWMVRVKYVFGVFILGTAVYYAYVGYGLLANRWVDPASVSAGVEEQLKAGWHASLATGLAEAQRDGKPVLIDLWATWCKNCLTMDKTTLADADVKAALANYVKIKFQAEDPEASPAKDLMQHIDAVGLPAYVILKSR